MSNTVNTTAVDHIANTITRTLHDKIIFSDPIEKDGILVIPVAKVAYGLGGGRANKNDEGGGGGFFARPVGYIEIKEGQTNFKAIRDPFAYVPVLIVGGIVASLVLRSVTRLFRA